MKTICRFLISILMQTFFWGCVKAELAEKVSTVELIAAMEYETETRTSLSGLENGMYYPLWSAGDEIAVFADGGAEPSKFTLKAGEGTTVASFAGIRKGDEYVAVYPYDMVDSMADGMISLTLPQTQEYVPDSFGQGAFPMVSTGGSDGSLKFMNLCAILKISLTGRATIRSITVTANDKDTYLSGPALVNAAASKDFLVMAGGASNTVVLECKGAKVEEMPDFHIVIPSQTYKGGLTLEIDAYTDTITKVIDADLVFERSQIRTVKGLELAADVPAIIPEEIPDNEIWYVTTDDSILPLMSEGAFDKEVIYHTYENGKGIIRFEGALNALTSFWRTIEDANKLLIVGLPGSIDEINFNPFIEAFNLQKFIGPLASEDEKCLVLDNSLRSFASGCGLEEYVTPSGLTSIASGAFAFNTSLRKIVISEGIISIGEDAFHSDPGYVSKLEEVYLPSTLEWLGGSAFCRCMNIKKFYGDNKFVSDDGYSLIIDNYNNTGHKYIVSYASAADLSSYVIPDGVECIGTYCFYYADNLRELTFPDTILDIASSAAFEGTENIERINGVKVLEDNRSLVVNNRLLYVAPKGLVEYKTPEGVQCLNRSVFGRKQELEKVVIGDDVLTCQYTDDMGYAYGSWFEASKRIKEITISARMKDMGINPWGTTTIINSITRETTLCDSLESVFLRAVIPPSISGNSRNIKFDRLTIYVPKESYDAYMCSPDWAPYRGYFEPYDYGDLSEFYPDYISTDYSSDGTVGILQTATTGDGINIVLMGDGYSDRQIADGTYKTDMEFAYRNLFTEEPYKSHQDLFNVSYVNVVSTTEGYEHGGSALGCQFGEGTYVYGNDALCFEYAQNVVAEEDMDETLVVVVMNSDAYAGTCFMYYPIVTTKDYGSGASVAYFPKGTDEDMFSRLLHHEACGHGFAKLADEYYYSGTITDAEIAYLKNQNSWGWWKNTDFTFDPLQVKWAKFLEDERYACDGLGVFEGAHTYQFGAFRPTDYSIMRYNTGGFNAPSREAIYYRIHKLAYGDSWEYDYEKFVEYDAVNRADAAGVPQKRRANYVEKQYEPLHPPVVVGKTWREARW